MVFPGGMRGARGDYRGVKNSAKVCMRGKIIRRVLQRSLCKSLACIQHACKGAADFHRLSAKSTSGFVWVGRCRFVFGFVWFLFVSWFGLVFRCVVLRGYVVLLL